MDNTQIDAARAQRTPPNDLRSLGEYRLLRRLGEGGMGEVYLGFSERLNRQVAVKVLPEQFSNQQSYVDRFYREGKSGALLNHPHIVRTLNVGQDKATGKHYLVLEYVEGCSAQALLEEQGKLAIGDAVHIALDVACALEHAHSRNVVHRDIKPDNILLARSGIAKLLDFGIAKRTDEASHLTGTRQGFGTTPYMPYEQALSAKRADGRSDIYALGATLYHLLTGSVPFPGATHLEVIEKKNRGDFEPASTLNADVPPQLDRVLARMLARQPGDRYQTASELIVELERTGLAETIPSYADPERAKVDPWLQASLASLAEPTRLDPESPPRRPPTPPSIPIEERWLVRVRLQSGDYRNYKATTRQIIQRLRNGTMPTHVEAGQGVDDFHPLSHYPAFRELTPAPTSLDAEAPAIGTPPRRTLYRWLLGAALAAALPLGAWLLYVLTH